MCPHQKSLDRARRALVEIQNLVAGEVDLMTIELVKEAIKDVLDRLPEPCPHDDDIIT